MGPKNDRERYVYWQGALAGGIASVVAFWGLKLFLQLT